MECKARQVVAIEPEHDDWVVGNEPVVLIEFDFEGDTIRRLGVPDRHRHTKLSGKIVEPVLAQQLIQLRTV